jgi:C-terminal, D2-small domain, of ClpB protein
LGEACKLNPQKSFRAFPAALPDRGGRKMRPPRSSGRWGQTLVRAQRACLGCGLQLKRRIELTEAARRWLAERGFEAGFGARPLARVVEDSVKRPLTDELLFGKLQAGGTAVIDVEGDGITVRVG